MKNSLGFYRVEHHQGSVQIMELIPVEEFERYKKLQSLLSETQTALYLKTKKEKKAKDPVLLAELKSIKDELKRFSKQWFIVGSLYYQAIETGILDLPQGQGGPVPCKLTKIEDFDESKLVVSEDEDNSD